MSHLSRIQRSDNCLPVIKNHNLRYWSKNVCMNITKEFLSLFALQIQMYETINIFTVHLLRIFDNTNNYMFILFFFNRCVLLCVIYMLSIWIQKKNLQKKINKTLIFNLCVAMIFWKYYGFLLPCKRLSEKLLLFKLKRKNLQN